MKMYHCVLQNMTVQNNKSLVTKFTTGQYRHEVQDNFCFFSLSTLKRTDCEYLQANRAALYAAAACL